jgi:Flagellar P-ring protein/HEAT repeats
MNDNLRHDGSPPFAGGERPLIRGLLKALGTVAALVCCVLLTGCETSDSSGFRAPGGAPAPTFTGEDYLRGTVGSLARLRPGTHQPMLVSGYGIVVNLNGTGSTNAPAPLRQALINQMKKYGLGSANIGTLHMTPERVLADPDTAVVRIDGFIPPGSTKGLLFDVLVTAVDSQTTSLAGGTLWTATLGLNGAGAPFKYLREQATAYGPIYDNPYHDTPDTGEPAQFGRQQALVVAGGQVTAPRSLELVLNQSSYTRSRAIADRINDRFRRETDRDPIAKPLTDQLIKITIPPRFQADPGGLIDLVMHLYLQTGPGFEAQQARQLARVLEEDPQAQESVRLAWQALGRPVVQVLREFYDDPRLPMSLTSLEAGAWLGDERASVALSRLAGHEDPAVRARVAGALALLPRSLKGAGTLTRLLDDKDTSVRVAAYESLATINDRLITNGRVVVSDESGTGVKYIIDTIPSETPLVYISQIGVPRIVIFGQNVGFKSPVLARFWGNRLMVSSDANQDHINVFYQPYSPQPDEPTSIQLKANPDLKTLVYLLGHQPTIDRPNEGLGLTYSQVVDTVYQLCLQGHVDAPIEVVYSQLARQIAEMENTQPRQRPETGQPADAAPAQAQPVADENSQAAMNDIEPALGITDLSPAMTGRPDTSIATDEAQSTSGR